jgi:hypothetical protein
MPLNSGRYTPEWFGTREFKSRYGIGGSTQKKWRDDGLPYYRVPNSTKILYKREEVEGWLASNFRG